MLPPGLTGGIRGGVPGGIRGVLFLIPRIPPIYPGVNFHFIYHKDIKNELNQR